MQHTNMIITHQGFLLIFLLTFALLPKLSSSQYNDSPQNIETYYYYYPPPYYSPSPASAPPDNSTPPPPPPPPSPPPEPEPEKSSQKKTIMTVVGVTAASALAVAALAFLLVSRRRRRQNENESQNGNGMARSLPEDTRVDEEGLDVMYWNDLKKTFSASASRVHPHPGSTRTHQTEDEPLPSDLVDVSLGDTQYSGDLVGALFGSVASNRGNPDPNAKVFILDPLKSRETTALLTSLGISREDLIAALLRGKGLNAETLSKLTTVAPTSDEQSRILEYGDDPAMLADAESFLYSLLKAFPLAFTRIQWRLDFDSDMVVKVMEPLRILESGCDELRSRDSFLKLLQAVHNAAARLRAPAEIDKIPGFDLSTVGKLSEYRSTDGKTTLLHFVIHQVVRNEGRRCVLNRSNSISRQNRPDPDILVKEDKEKEFLMLGLPIVGGLSSEFTNARKAGDIDYDNIKNSLATLVNQIKDITPPEGAGRGFIESAELDIKAAQLEHKRVMNLVKKIAQYYQAGDPKPLQLFVIVKEFLSRIDQACVEIARSLQQHNSASGSGPESDNSQLDVLKTRVNFQRLPPDFFS